MQTYNVVLFSDTVQDLNGVSRFIQDMADYGKSDNFYVITSSCKQNYPNKINIINIKPFFRISMPFYKHMDLVFPNFALMKKEYKKLNPKAVIVSTPGFIGLCALMITSKNTKKIAIYHTDFPAYLYKNTKSNIIKQITTFFMKFFYQKFDVVFSRSLEYKKHLVDEIKISEDKIKILPSGINKNNFSPKFKDENFFKNFEFGKFDFKILYVGRLSVEKNFDFLLKIWKNISKNHKNLALVCCGEGEFLKKAKEYTKDNIFLVGPKRGEELAKFYANSDIFLFPSTTDTLGQVVMEAQCSGIPVIVSDQGGPQKLIKNNQSGFVLKIDENLWINKILDIINDDNLLKILKENSAYNSQNFYFSSTYKEIMEATK